MLKSGEKMAAGKRASVFIISSRLGSTINITVNQTAFQKT